MSNEVKTEAKEAKKEIKIDPAYQGYVFLGWASGLFESKLGEKRPYYNMYVFSPVNDYVSDEYEASGFKAKKKKCISPSVWAGMNPGDKVRLFFDDKGKVIEAVPWTRWIYGTTAGAGRNRSPFRRTFIHGLT